MRLHGRLLVGATSGQKGQLQAVPGARTIGYERCITVQQGHSDARDRNQRMWPRNTAELRNCYTGYCYFVNPNLRSSHSILDVSTRAFVSGDVTKIKVHIIIVFFFSVFRQCFLVSVFMLCILSSVYFFLFFTPIHSRLQHSAYGFYDSY